MISSSTRVLRMLSSEKLGTVTHDIRESDVRGGGQLSITGGHDAGRGGEAPCTICGRAKNLHITGLRTAAAWDDLWAAASAAG